MCIHDDYYFMKLVLIECHLCRISFTLLMHMNGRVCVCAIDYFQSTVSFKPVKEPLLLNDHKWKTWLNLKQLRGIYQWNFFEKCESTNPPPLIPTKCSCAVQVQLDEGSMFECKFSRKGLFKVAKPIYDYNKNPDFFFNWKSLWGAS